MSDNSTPLTTLGPLRFGSERWKSMRLQLTAELQKQGVQLSQETISDLVWAVCLQAWGAQTAHSVAKHCTRKVVGAIIWHGENLLLQQRLTGAIGMAPPAGHREEVEGSEEACKREVFEETGLTLPSFQLLAEDRRFEKCKRSGSDYHDWTIFQASVGEKTLQLAPDESVTIDWYPPYKVLELAARTEDYLHLFISDADWAQRPGLEVVWYYWLKDLGILDRLKGLAQTTR